MNIPTPKQLSSYFTLITSMRYNEGDTIEYMMEEISKVKMFLAEQANMYTLTGSMYEIHTQLSMKGLSEFAEPELMGYYSFFGDRETGTHGIFTEKESDELKNQQDFRTEENFKTYLTRFIMLLKIRNLEKMRLWSYIESVFFSPIEYRPLLFEGTMRFHYVPLLREILENGIQYYYMRAGEITIDDLLDRYKRFELFHIAALLVLVGNRDYIFYSSVSNRELASIIMMNLEDMSINPFAWVTLISMHFSHNMSSQRTIINVNDSLPIEREEYMVMCGKEGLKTTSPTDKPLLKAILYQNYVQSQLSPSFISEIEPHRNIGEAVENIYNLDRTLIEYVDRNELVYYGVRDGFSQYHAYTIEELELTFKQYEEFFLPDTIVDYPDKPRRWNMFSIPSIKVLLNHVLLQKSNSNSLSETILNLLEKINAERTLRKYSNTIFDVISLPNKHKFNIKMIQDLIKLPENKIDVSKVLAELLNIGLIIYEWHFSIMEIERDDIEKKAISLPERDMLDPKWEGNIRRNLMDYIIRTTDVMERAIGGRCGELRLYRMQEEELWISYDYEQEDTLIGTLSLMSQCVRYGLFEAVRQYAFCLYVSAIRYGKEILNTNISNVILSW